MAPIEPTAPDKLMTPANIVTLIRICLVPVFVLAIVIIPLYFTYLI